MRSRRCAMESMKLWARDGEAVRQVIELGAIAHIETASEELTDDFLLFAIESGLLNTWANAFPDPRREPEIGMEVIVAAHLAARFAGLYSMRKAGYVLRSARVLGVAACERKCSGLQTRACVGQRFVRIRDRAGQRSVQTSQHACAKGLQTRLWANTYCEWG